MPDLENETQVPELRFPEFRDRDGFKKTPLNKLLVETKTRNRDGKYGKEHVLSVSGEFGCVNQIELLGRSYAGESVANYHVVETGDIVYTKSPLKSNPFGIIKENKGVPGIVSTLYAVYRTTAKADPTFLNLFFSSDYNLNVYLQPLVNKGAKNDMKVKNSAVLLGNVFVPEVDEQEKISDCLVSLDELINAEVDTLEALRDQKKGLIQNLIPEKGTSTPKCRFPDFQGLEEWGQKSLSELAPFVTDKIPADSLSTDNYISTENMISNFGGIAPSSNLPEVTRVTEFRENDILISNIRPYLRKVWLADRNGGASNDVLVLRPMHEVGSRYLQYILKSDDFISYTMEGAKGVKMPRGDIASIGKYSVSFPSLETGEQQQIADCLSELDQCIGNLGTKILMLREFKKGLVQKMIPAPELTG